MPFGRSRQNGDERDDRDGTPTTDSTGESSASDTPPRDLITPDGTCIVCGASVTWLRVANDSRDARNKIAWTVCDGDGQPHQCPRGGLVQSNADDVPF